MSFAGARGAEIKPRTRSPASADLARLFGLPSLQILSDAGCYENPLCSSPLFASSSLGRCGIQADAVLGTSAPDAQRESRESPANRRTRWGLIPVSWSPRLHILECKDVHAIRRAQCRQMVRTAPSDDGLRWWGSCRSRWRGADRQGVRDIEHWGEAARSSTRWRR